MNDLLMNAVVVLTLACGALAVVVLNLRHRLRVAEERADWNAALATRAKATLRDGVQGLRLLGDEMERVNNDLA